MQMLSQLTAHLDLGTYSPTILTLSDEPPRSMRGWFEGRGIPVACLSQSRAAWFFTGGTALANAIRSLDPHIVHSHGFRADIALTRFDTGAAHCCTIHNIPSEDYPRMYGAFQGGLMARAHVRAFRRIAAPVAVSESIGRTIAAEHGLNVRVIQNGINTDEFTPASKSERAALRTSLGLPAEAFVYVTAAPLITRKDPLTIIEAFLRLHEPDTYLVVLGDGPLRGECESRARNAAIRMPGFREDVREWLRASDAYISASLAEGLPMAVLEAFACGLPVVLSDIGPHREAAGSSTAARLFRTSDIDSCAAAIHAAMTGDSEQIRIAARDRVVGEYSAARMSARYQELYNQLTT
ncbi:MAG: glycosyltransferase family 4 protein [Ignavibacteriae bacterium]|nr:glycosyltransferase family 4 protein [Ignavibacteriota bacterium]